MEGLRHSLLAPSGATVLMIFSTADAMMKMVKTKYSVKDDKGKLVFPHPFAPWTPVDKKYEEDAGKVVRAYRMFENVKEWTFMSLPLMWIYAGYAPTIPFVTQKMVDISVIGSALVFLVGNRLFVNGYLDSADNRVKGFKFRTMATKFWLFGSAVAVGCSALQKFGVLKA